MHCRDFFEVLLDKLEANIFAFIVLLSVDMEAKHVKRERALNFSAYENSILLDLVDKHKIKSKIKTDGMSLKKRKTVGKNKWILIVCQVCQSKIKHYAILSPQHSLCPVISLFWLRDWILKRGKKI